MRQSQAVISTVWKLPRQLPISTWGAQQFVPAGPCGPVAPVGPAGPCGPTLHIVIQTPALQESGVPDESFDTVPVGEHAVPATTVSVICSFPAESVFPEARETSPDVTVIAPARAFNWETTSFHAEDVMVIQEVALGIEPHDAAANAPKNAMAESEAAKPMAMRIPFA